MLFGFLISWGIMTAQNDKDKNIQLIKNFLSVFFDESVAPETVVREYLIYGTYLKDKMSKTGFEGAQLHILKARLEKDKNQGWLVPNHKVADLTEYHVYPFEDFEHLNTLKINGFGDDKPSGVYVLLNPEEDEILQYFLVREGKISSFSLLVKGGDEAFFFGYGEDKP